MLYTNAPKETLEPKYSVDRKRYVHFNGLKIAVGSNVLGLKSFTMLFDYSVEYDEEGYRIEKTNEEKYSWHLLLVAAPGEDLFVNDSGGIHVVESSNNENGSAYLIWIPKDSSVVFRIGEKQYIKVNPEEIYTENNYGQFCFHWKKI